MKAFRLAAALAVLVLAAGGAWAQVTGTPMVIWGKPSGADTTRQAPDKPPPTARGPSAGQLAKALASGGHAPRVRQVACGSADQFAATFDCTWE
ncbi:MAG: hypothetical protein ACREEB_16110, partial [Caulobacteraceae bacterium]